MHPLHSLWKLSKPNKDTTLDRLSVVLRRNLGDIFLDSRKLVVLENKGGFIR